MLTVSYQWRIKKWWLCNFVDNKDSIALLLWSCSFIGITGYCPAIMVLPLPARLADPYDLPRIRSDQERVLVEFFHKDKNPQIADINIVAAELALHPYHVRVWFQHQLAFWRISQGLPPNNRKVYEIPQPNY